MLQLLELF